MKTNILTFKKKVKNLATRKNILLASLSVITCAVPAVSCAANSVWIHGGYIFDGKTYGSFDDVVTQVKKNSRTRVVEKEKDANWSLSINGVTTTFTDPQVLRQTIEEQYIDEVQVKTDLILEDFANSNGILDSGNKNIWNHIFSPSTSESRVYLGKDGLSYESADEAFMSFFEIQSGYLFNGIYFSSQSDLRNYLLNVYLPQNLDEQNKNTIVLKAPNGSTSAPIDLTQSNAVDQIKSFIESNSENLFQYTNPETNNRFSITKYNLDDAVDKVRLADLEGYLHVQSNQGHSNYVIDNHYEDGNNLIGPYYYDGVLDVGAFQNKDMWKKVIGIDKQVYVESKIDSIISTFMSSIINDDPVLNRSQYESMGKDPYLFRTLLETPEKTSYDEWFMQELGKLSPELKAAVIEVNFNLMDGKKYNVFDKIPILYNFMMHRVVSWGLGLDVQNLIVEYFSRVCDFIQDSIEMISLYDPVFLQSKDGRSTFNVKDFFNIGNPEYDLSTTVEYFRNQIKTTYPNLIALMAVYIEASNNISIAGGMIPFEATDYSFLYDFGIFDKNTEDYIKLIPSLKVIHEIFSQLNYDNMQKLYINNAKREDIAAIKALPTAEQKAAFEKLTTYWTKSSLDILLSGIGAKNNQYFQMANSLLKTEIQTFLETGTLVKGGYLSKLYSPNPNENKLMLFVEYVSKNAVNDVYKVYLAFMLDKRLSLGVINQETVSSPYAFAQAIARIALLGFGTSLLVGNSVKSLYGKRSYDVSSGNDVDGIPTPSSNPILNLFKKTNKDTALALNGGIGARTGGNQSIDGGLDIGGDESIWYYFDVSETDSSKLVFVRADQAVHDSMEDIWEANEGSQWDSSRREDSWWNDDAQDSWERRSSRVTMGTEGAGFNPIINGSSDLGNNPSNGESLKDRIWRRIRKLDYLAEKHTENIHRISRRVSGSGVPDISIIPLPFEAAQAENAGRFNYKIDLARNSGIFSSHGAILVDIDDSEDGDFPNRPTTPDGGDGSTTNPGGGGGDGSTTNPGGGGGDGSTTNPGGGGGDGSTTNPGGGGDGSNGGQSPDRGGAFEQRRSWWSGTSEKFDKFKNAISTIADFALEIFAVAATAMELFFFFYELFSVKYTQEFYVYVTTDGTEFIWDGGISATKYLGFVTENIQDIGAMKLIKPIQISLPQIEEAYFYNGIKYFDIKEMKYSILKGMVDGTGPYNEKKFTKLFTFTDNSNENYSAALTIEELISEVITDLGLKITSENKVDFSGLNKDSIYLSSINLSLGNGIIIPEGDNNGTVANNIVDNIRKTFFVVKPDVDANGFATGSISNEFVYPGNYWDGTKVVTQDKSQFSYILEDNSANDLIGQASSIYLTKEDFVTSDITLAEQKSRDKLYALFKTTFNLETKDVLPSGKINSNFNEIGKSVSRNIYKVKLPNGVILYFVDRESASNYIYGYFKLTKNTKTSIEVEYYYNGFSFSNEKELVDWIRENVTTSN